MLSIFCNSIRKCEPNLEWQNDNSCTALQCTTVGIAVQVQEDKSREHQCAFVSVCICVCACVNFQNQKEVQCHLLGYRQGFILKYKVFKDSHFVSQCQNISVRYFLLASFGSMTKGKWDDLYCSLPCCKYQNINISNQNFHLPWLFFYKHMQLR